MQLGWPYPKRIELLKRLADDKQTPKNTWPVEFQGKTLDLVRHHVPIEMPKYNLKNGRTSTPQKAYLAKHDKLPADLFEADPESDVAQEAQHEILKELVSDKGLLAYFRKTPQKIPLFLTSTGIVLNGNRRLCAMRLLYAEDNKKYQHFRHIEIIILPESDPAALSDLEFNLQIKQDIQSDYSWTAEAYMFRQRIRELKSTLPDMAARAGKSKAQLEQLFDMLDYADVYLGKRNLKDRYDLVDDKEFAFRKLVSERKNIDGEQKELYQGLAFALIDDTKGDRAYQSVQDIAKFIEPITSRLSERLEIKSDGVKDAKLDDLLGGRPSKLGPLIAAVEETANGEVVREVISQVVTAQKALLAEKKRNDFVVVQVQKANTLLNEALVAAADGMSRVGLSEQLVGIEETIRRLRAWSAGDS